MSLTLIDKDGVHPARRFVLAVDLDGVVADFMKGLRPIAAEWLGVPLESLTEEVTYGFPEWKLERCGGYDALHRFGTRGQSKLRYYFGGPTCS